MFIKNNVIFNELLKCVSHDNPNECMGIEVSGITIINLLLILGKF